MPLAPFADLSGFDIQHVVKQMEARIDMEALAEERGFLWTATLLLMGLKYEWETAQDLLKGVQGMKESSTYQALLEEGRVEGRAEEARAILLRFGTKRFGEPTPQTHQFIAELTSKERIEQLIDRALEVESWDELFN